MKNAVVVLLIALVSSGCATAGRKSSASFESFGGAMPAVPYQQAEQSTRLSGRMLAWNGNLGVEVWDVSNAVEQATAAVTAAGGYVQNSSSQSDGSSVSLTLRIPAKDLARMFEGLSKLGDVQYSNLSSRDVTEEYVDTDARLANAKALRDRLRALLDKAVDVKDIVAIETELNRVQSDIDSMEARIKALKGEVDMATLYLTFDRKTVLGPLGYVFKGLFWAVEKLFVIRD